MQLFLQFSNRRDISHLLFQSSMAVSMWWVGGGGGGGVQTRFANTVLRCGSLWMGDSLCLPWDNIWLSPCHWKRTQKPAYKIIHVENIIWKSASKYMEKSCRFKTYCGFTPFWPTHRTGNTQPHLMTHTCKAHLWSLITKIYHILGAKLCVLHYWDSTSPHVWPASWPLAPILLVTLQPNYQNISHFRCDLQSFALSITGTVSVPMFGRSLDL